MSEKIASLKIYNEKLLHDSWHQINQWSMGIAKRPLKPLQNGMDGTRIISVVPDSLKEPN